MANRSIEKRVDDETIVAAYQRLGNKAAVAREVGMSRSAVGTRLTKLGADDKPYVSGRRDTMPVDKKDLPSEGEIKRYIVTCAQNNTAVEPSTWATLQGVAKHYDAEILVSRFTYNKNAYSKQVKPDRGPTDADKDTLWYDPAVVPYFCDMRTKLAPGLVFCGEMQMLPTAVDPLGGFETYTGRKSGIFPHPRLAMRSVASAKGEPTKFNFTTGTVTQRNYVQARAGLRAEWHHTYGALLVEVDENGDWWVRQLQSDDSGTVHDLDLKFRGNRVWKNQRVEAINWGDVHATHLEDRMFMMLWDGPNSMGHTLRPKYQFMHDLVDIHACNHHGRNNAHLKFANWVNEKSGAEKDLKETAMFLRDAEIPKCETVVVNSNHDNWIKRWLAEADYKQDPENALYFLEAQLEVYRAIAEHRSFDVVAWSVQRAGCSDDVTFLKQDESFIICPKENGGIECGGHGHLGANGARGNPKGFARSGRRTNTGHTHSAGIWDGSWVAGVTGALDMGYNKGLSSWSHSHIVTHTNGKRQLVTCWNDQWRA